MKKVILFFLMAQLLIFNLQADKKCSLSSDYLASNDDDITLSGNVKMEYNIGKLSSQNAILSRASDVDGLNLDFLRLSDTVDITFRDYSRISCHLANINYTTLTANFFSGESASQVVYTNDILNTSGDVIPIVMKSKNINLRLIHNQDVYDVNNIFAQNDVEISYGSDIETRSQRAVYHNVSNGDEAKNSVSGVIFLMPLNKGDLCTVSDNNNNKVEAKNIRLDTNKHSLSCSKMNAKIYQQSGSFFSVQADKGVWDINNGLFSIRENVILKHPNFGKISCEESLDIFQTETPNGPEWTNLSTQGTSSWTFYDKLGNDYHNIISHGSMDIDDIAGKVDIKSPFSNGLPRYKQVIYSNKTGQIYGNTISLEYGCAENGVAVNKILIDGNVRIINKLIDSEGNSNDVSKYILADFAEYNPENNSVLLKSNGDKNVLLLDRLNDLQVSSKAISIDLTDGRGRESVQGLGKVRFSFSEKEYEEFKNNFNLEMDNL